MQITLKLSSDSVREALRRIQAYRANLSKVTDRIVKRLAAIGLDAAVDALSELDSTRITLPTVTITLRPHGATILMEGEQATFIEYGAGIFYNGPEPYPVARPDGIVGIGEYGKKKGQGPWWIYHTDEGGGKFITTHGTKAVMPMYRASTAMREQILEIVREELSR